MRRRRRDLFCLFDAERVFFKSAYLVCILPFPINLDVPVELEERRVRLPTLEDSISMFVLLEVPGRPLASRLGFKYSSLIFSNITYKKKTENVSCVGRRRIAPPAPILGGGATCCRRTWICFFCELLAAAAVICDAV